MGLCFSVISIEKNYQAYCTIQWKFLLVLNIRKNIHFLYIISQKSLSITGLLSSKDIDGETRNSRTPSISDIFQSVVITYLYCTCHTEMLWISSKGPLQFSSRVGIYFSYFQEWAVHTGRFREGVDPTDYPTWKTRFRCALNKLPDIQEVKEYSKLDGTDPFRAYRFLTKDGN